MRARWVLVCLTLLCAGCELIQPKPPTQQSTPQIARETRVEEINCRSVPPLEPAPPARAANATDALVEEEALRGYSRELLSLIRSLWECINEHNAKAEKANERR